MTRDPAFEAECRSLVDAVRRFPTLVALRESPEWRDLGPRLTRVLGTVRRTPPPATSTPTPHRDHVRAVHWNIEHGNWYPQVEQALRENPALADADLVSLNEIDLGMARAGNRDVAADLAAALGMYGAWAPLFLETTVGRDDDATTAAGLENHESLFGVAILSRWPIGEARIIDLPSPERYQFDLERMYGRHIALVVVIERPGAPFVAVTVHLEVHRTRRHRADQVRVITETLAGEKRPIILAGDFNSHTFDRGRPWDVAAGAAALLLSPGETLRNRLLMPDRGPAREPLFDELRAAGFEWQAYADYESTLQLRFDRIDEVRLLPGFVRGMADRVLAWAERRASLRLDWFAGRGWSGGRGFTVPGIHGPGKASDHAPIVAEFR